MQLNAGGRCIFVKSATGHALNLEAPYKYFLEDPSDDGTYTYAKTGPTTATFTFTTAAGAKRTHTLNFSSETAGTITSSLYTPPGGTDADSFTEGLFSGGSNIFTLTNLQQFSNAPVSNLSLRGRVSAARPLIAGFVIPGTEARDVLIRAVGPSLSQFNVTEPWSDPDFEIFRGPTAAARQDIHYKDWSSAIPYTNANVTQPVAAFKKLFAYLGAFPLSEGSKDAAEVVRLSPGAYSIVCSAPNGDAGGEVLIEVYTLP